MALKPLIALTEIHLCLKPGVSASKDGSTPEMPPVTCVIPSFKKSGVAFMASDVSQQDEFFALSCVDFAPDGTPLDPEYATVSSAPAKKTDKVADKVAADKAAVDGGDMI